ncbi:MAG: GNAT family N-acetyltransferase [Planctomycetaceae bacterium]|nr:GNAT family N-acetyltransferase [Planctomycetaceae bacterium]
MSLTSLSPARALSTEQQSRPTAPTLRWRVYSRPETEEALQAWRELQVELQESGCANSAAWISCWVRHYGDCVPYQFLALEVADQTRGIGLITTGQQQQLGPFPIQTRHFGTAGEIPGESVVVEYNRALVHPELEAAFIQGCWEHLAHDLRWEQLCLDGFHADDLAPWQALLPTAVMRQRESRYFDFTSVRGSGKELLQHLGSSTRSNIRRRIKKYTSLKTEWIDHPHDATAAFEELITLHQARWHAVGQPGAFAAERFLAFQRDAVQRLIEADQAVVFRVQEQGETIGCLFLLRDRNRLLDYLSGFASFNEHPSIGLVSHYLCMEEALRRGFDAYDFLVGEKQHKQNLSNAATQLNWLTWTRPSWKSRLLQGLRSAKRLLTRWRRPSSTPDGESTT